MIGSSERSVSTSTPWVIVVNAVTLLGLGIGLLGVSMLPAIRAVPLLFASLLLDALDGFLARRTNASTELGAWLDWSSDVALGYALLFRILPQQSALKLVPFVVFLQCLSLWSKKRVSGRATMTFIALVYIIVLT